MHIYFFTMIAMSFGLIYGNNSSVTLSVSSSGKQSLKLALLYVAPEKVTYIDELARDLSFSGQWTVDIYCLKQMPSVQYIKSLAARYPLAALIQEEIDLVEWRLYDTFYARMTAGKKIRAKRDRPGLSHHLAQSIWRQMSGKDGSFDTCIAYCKETVSDTKDAYKHIYLISPDGSYEKPLVDVATINIAPRWNVDSNRPLLFYSEYTPANIRLMVTTMDQKRSVASNFDGVTMVPAFSHDGKHVVFCASHGDGACNIYHVQRGELQKVTRNRGNNVSPTFGSDANTLFFCSDMQSAIPCLYRYNMATRNMQALVTSAYCASPCYSPSNNAVVYARRAQGTTQLFVYHCDTNTHEQLTFDSGNKEECSWSPCGNYVAYAVQKDGVSRIAVFNMVTRVAKLITPPNQQATYPCWSPLYRESPLWGAVA